MSEAAIDSLRVLKAAKHILNDRDPIKEFSSIMVTLEGTVAAILLLISSGDHRNASGMLNEGLVHGVEQRLALAAANIAKEDK